MAKDEIPSAPGKGKEDARRAGFVKQMFSKYYSEAEVPAPDRLESREFGVITERAGMWRHLGFSGQAEMRAFLRKHAPLHAYHSSAYYQKPAARTMEEKGWLGADLIFDLDADHIKGSGNMTMEEMLAAVKVQFTKLLDDFLLRDFGFSERDVRIVFSGGRGYHAHVGHDKVRRLDSHERREIVDYITYSIPDIDQVVRKTPFETKVFQGHVSRKFTYGLYPKETPGWRGRVTGAVFDFLDRTEKMPREDIIAELSSFKGIGEKYACQIYESLYPGREGNRGLDKIRKLNLEAFREDAVRNSFIKHIIHSVSVEMGGETDEPVTSDVKRLIRLPESVHGKTGLVVRRLGISEYRDFVPLRDAVWKGFGAEAVRITGREDFGMSLAGETYRVSKGGEGELPAYAAVFFACQKKCDIRN